MAKNRFFKTTAWFMVGAAAGAVASLLYAPQSGTKTRKMIRTEGEKGYKYVATTTKELSQKGQDMYHRGVEWAEDAKKSVTDRVRAIAA